MTTGNETPDLGQSASAAANIAALAMAAIVCITMANVLVRYFTDVSLAWTEEISVFLLLVLTLAGCAVATFRDRMIRVSYLYERGSLERRRLLAALSSAASTAMFGALGILMFRQLMDEFRYSETTAVIGLPRWWYTGTLFALTLVVAWQAVASGVRLRRLQAVARLPDGEASS